MDAAMFSDLQFLLARVLWAPKSDRERALQLAELAARSHPDPDQRAAILTWLELRAGESLPS